ncbi:hypothetical protein AAFC00_005946 [Neodothiora populina]|uniref:Uncharacterized protein n=1 Tax=Neodothiora populina TaxID=2781224 RepID=A0ABR3P6F6_9PEZI
MDTHLRYLKIVESEHAELINCVQEIYNALIDLHYFHQEEIIYPPYGVPGKPSLATAELKRLGFTEEIIALLELLPYPSNEMMNAYAAQHEGLPMAPDSAVVSYLEGADQKRLRAARQPYCDGEIGLPAWAFKITTGGLDFGMNYIYDIRSKLMVRWDPQAQFGDFSDQPHRSPGEVMRLLVGELRSLDWLPWRVEHGHVRSMNIYSRPTYKQHMSSLGSTNRYSAIEDDRGINNGPEEESEIDNTFYSERVAAAKAAQNRYMYKRNLYEECGWPDNFRGEEFERRKEALETEWIDLVSGLGLQSMHCLTQKEGSKLRDWYKEKAGSRAVC